MINVDAQFYYLNSYSLLLKIRYKACVSDQWFYFD